LIVTKICNILSTAILAAIIAFVAGVMGPKLFGYEPMAVLSGSMAPEYPVGALVFVDTKAYVGDVSVGDVITFHSFDRQGKETIVTHRVMDRDDDSRSFGTKGDANDARDAGRVLYENFVGRPAAVIPALGQVLINLPTPRGIAAGCILAAALIALFVVPVFLRPDEEEGGLRLPEADAGQDEPSGGEPETVDSVRAPEGAEQERA
jgi:signal peptidase